MGSVNLVLLELVCQCLLVHQVYSEVLDDGAYLCIKSISSCLMRAF